MGLKPRLLVVSPTFSYPLISGGKIRIYHILRQLSQRFHITLVTLAEPGDDTNHNRLALDFLEDLVPVPIKQTKLTQLVRLAINSHRWLLGEPSEILVKRSGEMYRTLKQLLSSKNFDAAQLEYTQTMQYLPLIQSFGIPCLVVAHDVSHVSQKRKADVYQGINRTFWAAEARRMRVYEQRYWSQSDRIIAMSKIDREHILKSNPTAKVDIVPNGVTVRSFNIHPKSHKPKLVFVGWMRHLPNRDALAWFLDSIWPIIRKKHSGVNFEVIGRGAPKKLQQKMDSDSRVNYLGYVENVQSCVSSAWVSVVPIRIGSGSRLKILESMALDTAVVSTTVGCEGLAVTNGQNIRIADNPDEFARTIVELLENQEARMQLASNGRKIIEEHYEWERIGMLASDAVFKTVQDKGQTTGLTLNKR
jgi:glycosyltransferase involved in cell wall biosynthesis